MNLYFLRHGIAEDRRPDLPDAERRLTPEGTRELRAMGRGLRALDLRPEVVLTSPLVRARQTAQLAAEALGCPERLREDYRLAAGAGFGDMTAVLEGVSPESRVLLVGHEPDLSEMIAALIGGGMIRMKKASLACVSTPRLTPAAGELRWLLTASLITRLGE